MKLFYIYIQQLPDGVAIYGIFDCFGYLGESTAPSSAGEIDCQCSTMDLRRPSQKEIVRSQKGMIGCVEDTFGCEKCPICIYRSNYLLSALGVFTVCIYS